MRLRFPSLALLLALMAGTMAACRKKPEPPPAPVETPTPPPPPPVTPPPPPPRGPDADSARRAMEARNAADIARKRTTLLEPVYFDYDQDALRSDAQQTLEAKVPILLANRELRLRIAGHTDNRGSDEYNIALGQRRAAAALRYLQSRGIVESRIDIISFGEDRPVCSEEAEGCWSRNRRDEFEIVAGGDQIRADGQ